MPHLLKQGSTVRREKEERRKHSSHCFVLPSHQGFGGMWFCTQAPRDLIIILKLWMLSSRSKWSHKKCSNNIYRSEVCSYKLDILRVFEVVPSRCMLQAHPVTGSEKCQYDVLSPISNTVLKLNVCKESPDNSLFAPTLLNRLLV